VLILYELGRYLLWTGGLNTIYIFISCVTIYTRHLDNAVLLCHFPDVSADINARWREV